MYCLRAQKETGKMSIKCQCPNCGYKHLTEHVRVKVEALKTEQKEDDGTETVG